MVWVLEPCEPGAGPSHVLVAGSFLVGRKSADVTVDVPSVSREHARITVHSLPSANLNDLESRPLVEMSSLGKFGSQHTPRAGKEVLLKPGVPTPIGDGDLLRFAQAPQYRLRHSRIALSAPPGSVPLSLQGVISQAGIHLVEYWATGCTHVLMTDQLTEHSGPSEMAAALCGQLAGVPVVSAAWVQAIVRRPTTTDAVPDHGSFEVQFDGIRDIAKTRGLLAPFAFSEIGDTEVLWALQDRRSHLLEVLQMAGGQVLLPGSTAGAASGRERIHLAALAGQSPQGSDCRWTTPDLAIAALKDGSVTSLLRDPNVSGKRSRSSMNGSSQGLATAKDPLEGSGSDEDPHAKRHRIEEPEIIYDSDATDPPDSPVPAHNSPRCHGPAAVKKEELQEQGQQVGAVAPVAPEAPKEEASPPRPTASREPKDAPEEGSGAEALHPFRHTSRHCKAEAGAAPTSGLYKLSRCPLIVRPYNPPANCVVKRSSGVSVLPNFKKFRKAGHAGSGARPMNLVTCRWVQPVTESSVEFMETERERRRAERDAEELFAAHVRPVKGQPLPDPEDEEEEAATGRGQQGQAARAPLPARKPSVARPSDDAKVTLLASQGCLKTLKVPELKAYLSSHGLPVGGKKDDLIERITAHVL